MIAFFRKIRANLLAESKIVKYMMYAFGEIILVVIGILIALSINNWNQDRISADRESTYLENLEHDLENQLVSIDIQISYEQKYVDKAVPLLESYRGSLKLMIDSSSSDKLSILQERKTFVRTDPTYEDLISTGNIGLIRNRSLRNSIIEYYQELERIEKVIQSNNTLLVDHKYGMQMNKLVYLGGDSSEHLYEISNELLKEPGRKLAFINLVMDRYLLASTHVDVMNDLHAKTLDMIELLKNSSQ